MSLRRSQLAFLSDTAPTVRLFPHLATQTWPLLLCCMSATAFLPPLAAWPLIKVSSAGQPEASSRPRVEISDRRMAVSKACACLCEIAGQAQTGQRCEAGLCWRGLRERQAGGVEAYLKIRQAVSVPVSEFSPSVHHGTSWPPQTAPCLLINVAARDYVGNCLRT
jgi:hypothetical protein